MMEARHLDIAPRVQEVTDRAGFMALESEWNTLVETTSNELFYRHEFLRIWWDNFAPGARLRVLTLRDADGTLTAALPLWEERTALYGMPVRQLSALANSHSCRFDLVAREPDAAARAFLAHLRHTGGWDVLRLMDVPEGGAAWRLHAVAREAGLPVGEWESLVSPYIPLPASRDAYLGSLQSKFKANCRRRRRKLEEKGRVTFERVDGGLEHGGRYFLLKPGYDESLRECSPGQLLMEEVVGACIDKGLHEFDFLGPDMVWKRDWTDKARRHTWLYVFNDSALGRALCSAKFRWGPAVKEVVARWKR